MGGFFKKYPLATLATWAASVLAALVLLQANGILTGTAAHYADLAAGVLQVLLTVYARSKVTPVVNPKDDLGRPLVPATLVPPPR
jgi:hypothetical protein